MLVKHVFIKFNQGNLGEVAEDYPEAFADALRDRLSREYPDAEIVVRWENASGTGEQHVAEGDSDDWDDWDAEQIRLEGLIGAVYADMAAWLPEAASIA